MSARHIRPRAPTIFVDIDGVKMSLLDIEQKYGISYNCLNDRYLKGDRGHLLIRPSGVRTNAWKPKEIEAPPAVQAMAIDDPKLAQVEERRAAVRQLRAEHSALFARPLIDSSLLTPAEHAATLDRVKYSGQRSWRLKAGSY